MTQDSAQSIMERLKESTSSMHSAAESSSFQGELAQGALPLKVYGDYLEQLYLVHKTLEDEIAKHRHEGHKFADVVTPEQFQENFLKHDLVAMGREYDKLTPLVSTNKLMQAMHKYSASHAVALLGMHYVLLGSKHGGKFIAKSCQAAYQFDDACGVMYFDPYGPNFMPVWKAFKDEMNQLTLTDAEADALCEAAGLMFNGIGEIGAELNSRTASKV